MPNEPEQQASRELPKQYRPADFEPAIIDRWLASGAFHADPARIKSGEKRPYAILIPPPNVTAALHLGHALNNTLQDILIRAKRMQGFETLWMPGTDHAGIATQTVVDKRLQAEGKPALAEHKKMELAGEPGREKFVAEVQAFKDEYERRITDQLVKMGCSCDYDRQRFTMDPICARAVREAFFRLFQDGLIYRGKRLVNWDPVTQTALADDEVENEEVESSFWYMKYPVVDAAGDPTGEHVTVATTRPETYFGDTGIAVNPSDPERARFAGKHVKLPFVNRVIPIVADDYVVMPDPESSDSKAKYASGFLKVTPAHDPNDWDIGQRHGLDIINIMAPDASISDQHGWEHVGDATWALGLSREDARAEVEKRFRDAGLLADKKPYSHAVGHSYRSHAIVEPYLSDQWYVRVTDDKMRGSALASMLPEQRTTDNFRARGGTDLRAVPPTLNNQRIPAIRPEGFIGRDPYPPGERSPQDLQTWIRNLPHLTLSDATYFVTWRTAQGRTLSETARDQVAEALEHFHGDTVDVYAYTVMADHVHAIVRPFDGDKIRDWCGSVKRFSANAVNQSAAETGSLWQDEHFDHIVRDETWLGEFVTYILRNPVEAGLAGAASAYMWTRVADSVLRSLGESLPEHGSEIRATRDGSPGDGALEFTPERYAKTFEFWHENLRDWCISRQLWWGHRIPVWTWYPHDDFGGDGESTEGLDEPTKRFERLAAATGLADQFAVQPEFNSVQAWLNICARTADAERLIDALNASQLGLASARELAGKYPELLSNPEAQEAFDAFMNTDDGRYLRQDPDVLDTWFSSALWPLSTMGWPNHGIQAPDPRVLLPEDPGSLKSIYVKRVNTWSQFVGTEGDYSADLIDRLIFLREKDADKLVYQLFSAKDLSLPLYTPDEIQDCDDLVCAVGLKQHGEVMTEKFGAMHLDNWLLSHGFVNTTDLLGAFNPTNVLCTAREIITLWVSRMVMFNRYFLTPTGSPDLRAGSEGLPTQQPEDGSEIRPTPELGHLPFTDVFIHAMIQDGEGRKMSKSLGNGVDPLDIIATHGADAMRFTLAKMTTQTQDVRMPVEHDEATGKNTSPKFDEGRNFCNKLWNAARFTLSILDRAASSKDQSVAQASKPVTKDDLSLLDRWMLSRLASTAASINANIDGYEYASYAQSLYDLLWRDFCDWYLEASKPTIDSSTAQQAVLRQTLDTILRLLHPISPFITEAIHEQLADRTTAPVAGLELASPDEQGLLCTAGWPIVDASLTDQQAEQDFDAVRAIVEAIRQVRAQHQVKPKQRLTLHTDAGTLAMLEQADAATKFLAGLDTITADAPSEDAVKFTHASSEHFLSGLAAGVDKDAETKRLTELLAKLDKDIKGLEGRLSNPGYTDKAPEHLVNQTRQQLTDKQEERTRAAAALEALS